MRLDQFIASTGQTDTAFAVQIGVTSEAVRRYRNGTRIPDRAVMERIFAATDGAVQPNDFYPAVAQSVLPAVAEAANG